MAGVASQSEASPEIAEIESLAKRWLSSVHAVWEPRLENRQITKDEVVLTFMDRDSQKYTLLMDGGGKIKDFRLGGQTAAATPSATRRPEASVPSKESPAALAGPRTSPSTRPEPPATGPPAGAQSQAEITAATSMPGPAQLPNYSEYPMTLSQAPRPARTETKPSPTPIAPTPQMPRQEPTTAKPQAEAPVHKDIKAPGPPAQTPQAFRKEPAPVRSQAVVPVQTEPKTATPSAHVPQVTRQEIIPVGQEPASPASAGTSVSQPWSFPQISRTIEQQQGTHGPDPARARPPARPPTSPSGQPDETRLISITKQWLSSTIGLDGMEVAERSWEGGRLRLIMRDPEGNSYRVYAKPPDVVEEFKPL